VSLAIITEGPSDKPVIKRTLSILRPGQNPASVPVRAGHGPYQGEAILDHLQDVVRVASEDKIIVIVDAGLAAKAASVVQGPPPTGKVVCVLVAP
jgi:hypothetical protein